MLVKKVLKAMSDSLFHTEVVNEHGISGEAYVKDGLKVMVSSPLSDEEGTNPEELFGLAWATCLNATIQALLNGRGLTSKSRVEVAVDYERETNGIGFYFDLHAYVAIEGASIDETERFMNSAHQKCPVSKIISDYQHTRLTAVPFK